MIFYPSSLPNIWVPAPPLFPTDVSGGFLRGCCTKILQGGRKQSNIGGQIGKNSLICLEDKSMTPRWGNTSLLHSSQQLPVLDPQKAFWADKAPLMGLQLASSLASRATENQGHCQVCSARCECHRTLSRTTFANLDCVFVENTHL